VGDVEDHSDEFGAHVRKYVKGLVGTAASEDWTRIEVVEVELSRRGDSCPDQSRTAADHFEERWSQILADVDRDWINISGCGVQDGVLVLAVEWFGGRGNGRSTHRSDRISVNFSGHIGVCSWPWPWPWPWAGRPGPLCQERPARGAARSSRAGSAYLRGLLRWRIRTPRHRTSGTALPDPGLRTHQ
jgi:hypothetical protein